MCSHQAPTSLSAVIDRLEEDSEYLTEGGVFTPDLIETWIAFKRNYEIAPVNLRPTPYEFALYYDV
jgi:glutamine synthetase